jgi:hypothetical protein
VSISYKLWSTVGDSNIIFSSNTSDFKMFQVASHPINVPFGPVPTQMGQQYNPVQLPRTLTRPQLKNPSEAIASVDRELAGVPLEYVWRGLRDMGDE